MSTTFFFSDRSHKRAKRKIPDCERRYFEPLWDKVRIDSSKDDDELHVIVDPPKDDELQIVVYSPKNIREVVVIESDDDIPNSASLLLSDDPELQKLLQVADVIEPKRRVHIKTQATSTPPQYDQLVSLTHECAAAQCPADWAAITATMKKETAERLAKRGKTGNKDGNGKKKKKKTTGKKDDKESDTKKKTTSKKDGKRSDTTRGGKRIANSNPDEKTIEKREHSKVWHAEKSFCMTHLGLDETAASERASIKARARIAELRASMMEASTPA